MRLGKARGMEVVLLIWAALALGMGLGWALHGLVTRGASESSKDDNPLPSEASWLAEDSREVRKEGA